MSGRYRSWYSLGALIAGILVACVPGNSSPSSSPGQAPTHRPILSTPTDLTIQPTANSAEFTATPEEMVSAVSRTPTSESGIHFPLPDVAVGLSEGTLPWLKCLPDGAGQVWVMSYPYEKVRFALADKRLGYYRPIWSPNGEWLAYIAVDRAAETDQVLISSIDGALQKPLGAPLHHRQTTTPNECIVTESINSPLRWSPTGDSLVFVHTIIDGGSTRGEYYLANVATGESRKIADSIGAGFLAPAWSGDGRYLAFPGDHLQIFDNENTTAIEVPFPVSLGASTGVASLDWMGSNSSLVVGLYDASRSVDADVSLWAYQLATGEWHKLATIGKTGADYPTNPVIGDKLGATCGKRSNRTDFIDLMESSRWTIVGGIETVKSDCRVISLLTDALKEPLVGFASNKTDRPTVWIAQLLPGSQEAEQVIDLRLFDTPENLTITALSWRH